MATVRLDTLRNQINATGQLLGMVSEELEDLHVLAYERATAAEEAKVSGGSHDYALDTHGDPRARHAYRLLGETVDEVCATLDSVSHDALNLLRQGNTPGRGQRRLRLVELGEAIAAQSRRARRGEYTPIRRGPQPDRDNALEQMRKERDTALRKIAKITKQRDRAVALASRQRRGSTS